MRALNIKTILSLVSLIFLFVGPESSYADSLPNHPFFEKTERVYIYINYGTHDVDESLIPDLLKEENIKKRIYELYVGRFSSDNCQKYIKLTRPYNCNDQPVFLISEEDLSKYFRGEDISIASSEDLRRDGSLHVWFSVTINGNSRVEAFNLKLNSPIVNIITGQDLIGSEYGIKHKVPQFRNLSLNQSLEDIEFNIDNFLGWTVY